MKPLPIGIQTFQKIIEEGFLYVDKTSHIYKLIQKPSAYFLARPRRFGKSLTLSVLDEIFSANKELFRGLWIYTSSWEWKKYPVLRFDLSKQKANTTEQLIEFLQIQLSNLADKYEIKLKTNQYYDRFQELIEKVAKTEKVVILIDEYDKPIIDHLEDTSKAIEMREVMKGFFTVLKGSDPFIRFLFLTGVSKFSKAGVFSNLNHLDDISLNDTYCDLVGITEEELINNFSPYITDLAQKENSSSETIIQKIRDYYNGYKFSPEGKKVYNPFSTLLLFQNKRFEHYWFETGTPEFLVKLIWKNQFDLVHIPFEAESIQFSSYEVDKLNLIPLLLQTGYLTIKEYNKEENIYTLDYPNYEVRHAFLNYLFQYIKKEEPTASIFQLYSEFKKGNLEECMEIIKKIFLSINYDIQIQNEKYYQTIFYLIFTLLGFRIQTEVKTNLGRIDAVVHAKSIYIFEFKLNDTAENALRQIHQKRYYEKFANLKKPIVLVGVEFKDKNIGNYVVEELSEENKKLQKNLD
jgi:hypothetical protein